MATQMIQVLPKNGEYYIVDYDLPAGNSRVRFYRAMRKFLRDNYDGGDDTGITGWSTQSVVITQDKEFADFVYGMAKHIGRANMYHATKLK